MFNSEERRKSPPVQQPKQTEAPPQTSKPKRYSSQRQRATQQTAVVQEQMGPVVPEGSYYEQIGNSYVNGN